MKYKAPGPGEYQIPGKAFDNKFRFHMGIKVKDSKTDSIPGPGEYDAHASKVMHKSMPAYSY